MQNLQLKDMCNRVLKRLQDRHQPMKAQHLGNEMKLTYHAGYDLGYLEWYIAAIEKIIDEIEVE